MSDHHEPAQLSASLLPTIRNLVRWIVRDNGTQQLSRTAASTLSTLRDEGRQRITKLARIEHVSQPTMTGMIKRLADAGWVTRHVDVQDRRVVEIDITPAGREVIAEWLENSEAVLAARLAEMTPDQRAALAQAAEALAELASVGD